MLHIISDVRPFNTLKVDRNRSYDRYLVVYVIDVIPSSLSFGLRHSVTDHEMGQSYSNNRGPASNCQKENATTQLAGNKSALTFPALCPS